MSEYNDALRLAERLLDEPNADPDDDLRVLSRQLLRRVVTIERLKKRLAETLDPTRDLIEANRDTILRFHEEAIRRIERCLNRGLPVTALAVIRALNLFHPMHAESWRGWPEDSDP